MRIMGLDVGDKTIGIAISDALQITAQGKETLFRESLKSDIDQLVQWIVSYEVHKIVVGLPLNMNGSLGPQGEKTKQFAEKLEKKLKHSTRITEPVEIVYWDERLTTLGANRMLIETDMRREKRKKVVDTVAAVLILQGYLDGNREA
ncbi:Holliday junction resolvase RuvX [Fusibacter tunisiensis]|uniref:Putative pre-16S rRNA nuclease n=1 Tax=Fusibacter tunisiensis TaxID=1008308 RepID=A0ABS2MQA3_9FIRM|nr:Holliday junction resolvase RuvX [Fusibacter tunisiensis]MBM7561581.1 putative Holliday junction resolvase [Fusibacter tunisiensis]